MPLWIAVLAFGLLGGRAVAYETPKMEVVQRYRDFEVRRYPPQVVAQTEVEGDQGSAGNRAFPILAGYIFGKNHGERKIAMTAPVTQAPAGGAKIAMTAPVTQQSAGPRTWRVEFMMPSEYSLETLPQPDDPRVHLEAVPPRKVAAIRYSGSWSQKNYDKNLEKLREGMKREGLAAKGEPVWARYDPPFKPWFLRTNEILIEVE